MSLRSAKQIIYGALYLIFWGGLATVVYYGFLRPAPSCFDKIKNQGEEGIDCGGPCAKSCGLQAVKPIDVVGQVSILTLDARHVSLFAQISNPNINFAAQNFHYVFSLTDTQGQAQSITGDSFIYGGEVKYLIVPNVSLSQSANSLSAALKTSNEEWGGSEKLPGPARLVVQGIAAQTPPVGVTLDGRVVNSDTVLFPRVNLVAIFFGKSGQTIGVSQTVVDNLSPNESRPFSILHPPLLYLDAAATRIFAYALRP